MTTIKAFIKRHPVLTYYALVFATSWAGGLIVLGPGGFLGTQVPSQKLFLLAILAGIAGPSIAGILLTGLVGGRAGFRDLASRLFKWRVGVRWYAVALLTAPILMMATLLALSLTSPVFLPAIFSTDDKVSLLVPGIAAGLVGPFFEELGWTGFAIPQLRKRYGILSTGIIVGLLWGVWHAPLFAASANFNGAVTPVLYLVILLFSWLLAYRVLMVWAYDHTKSLLLMMLMHMPIVVGGFVLVSPAMSGVPTVAYDLVFAAALWVIVAAVTLVERGQLSRQPIERRVA